MTLRASFSVSGERKARADVNVSVSAYPERHPQSPTDDHDLDVLAADAPGQVLEVGQGARQFSNDLAADDLLLDPGEVEAGAGVDRVEAVDAGVDPGVDFAPPEIARERAKKSPTDPVLPILMGEMENQLAITQVMHRSAVAHANNWDFEPTVENGNTGFIHKTVIVRAAAATVAAAMLDRLLHRSVVFDIDGDSYRMRAHRARARKLTEGGPA